MYDKSALSVLTNVPPSICLIHVVFIFLFCLGFSSVSSYLLAAAPGCWPSARSEDALPFVPFLLGKGNTTTCRDKTHVRSTQVPADLSQKLCIDSCDILLLYSRSRREVREYRWLDVAIRQECWHSLSASTFLSALGCFFQRSMLPGVALDPTGSINTCNVDY